MEIKKYTMSELIENKEFETIRKIYQLKYQMSLYIAKSKYSEYCNNKIDNEFDSMPMYEKFIEAYPNIEEAKIMVKKFLNTTTKFYSQMLEEIKLEWNPLFECIDNKTFDLNSDYSYVCCMDENIMVGFCEYKEEDKNINEVYSSRPGKGIEEHLVKSVDESMNLNSIIGYSRLLMYKPIIQKEGK